MSIERLRNALMHTKPVEPHLDPVPEGTGVEVGQVWMTVAKPSFPPGLPDIEADIVFPVVVVLSDPDADLEGHTTHWVCPVSWETEMAAHDDLLLPAELFGARRMVCCGMTFSILDASLDHCMGKLPDEWYERVRALQFFVQGEEHKAEGHVGLPYLDERDVRFRWHEEMIDRIAYLQIPIMVWMEQTIWKEDVA